MNRQEAGLFLRRVTERCGHDSSVRNWTEFLASDEVLATAFVDRLLHKASVSNVSPLSRPLPPSCRTSLGLALLRWPAFLRCLVCRTNAQYVRCLRTAFERFLKKDAP